MFDMLVGISWRNTRLSEFLRGVFILGNALKSSISLMPLTSSSGDAT